jgi:hypothetical protein
MHEIRSTILSGDEKPSTPIACKAKSRREGGGLGGLSKIAIRREEARVTNQRSEDRHRNVVAGSVITFRRRKHEVRVVNVSSRGAMIEAELEPRIGEKIDIQFTPDTRTRCVVRWVREGRIGLEFVDETILWDNSQVNGPVADRRAVPDRRTPESEAESVARAVAERAPRQALIRNGSLYWNGITIPVRLRNISEGGARIDSDHDLRPGTEVELDLGEAGFQVAEVRWSRDGQIGLRFAEEFDLDSLAPGSLSEGSGRVPGMLKPAYLETELRSDSPWAARYERLSITDLKIINPEQ